jgi:hypothetical protein
MGDRRYSALAALAAFAAFTSTAMTFTSPARSSQECSMPSIQKDGSRPQVQDLLLAVGQGEPDPGRAEADDEQRRVGVHRALVAHGRERREHAHVVVLEDDLVGGRVSDGRVLHRLGAGGGGGQAQHGGDEQRASMDHLAPLFIDLARGHELQERDHLGLRSAGRRRSHVMDTP